MKGAGTDEFALCSYRIPEHCGRVLWQVTNLCNYQCPYCIFSSSPEKIPDELTAQQALPVLEDLKRNEFSHIKFTGGEPFCKDDFMDLLIAAAERGFVIDVSTNASRITEERARTIASLDISMVHVSVDGPDRETHEAARGPGTYAPTVRGLERLARNGVYVRVGTVLFDKNEHRIPEMARAMAELGASEVIFSRMAAIGRLAGDTSSLAKAEDDELVRRVETARAQYGHRLTVSHSLATTARKHGRCPGYDRMLYIDNLGRVGPCAMLCEANQRFLSEQTLATHSVNELLAKSHSIEERGRCLVGAYR